jgi:hypothetical protein
MVFPRIVKIKTTDKISKSGCKPSVKPRPNKLGLVIAEALEVEKISDSGRTLAVKVRIMVLNNYKNRSELMLGASAMTGEGLDEVIQWVS